MWISYLILLSVVILAWLKKTENKKLLQLFSANFTNKGFEQYYREDFSATNRFSATLFLLFAITIFIIASVVNFQESLSIQSVIATKFISVWVLLGVLTYYILKIISIFFIGIVLDITDEVRKHVYFTLLNIQVSGLLLFPFAVILSSYHFSETIRVKILAISVMVFFLFKLIRGFWLTQSIVKGIGNIYLFLYLCTLEILPFILIVKYLLF